MEVLCPHCDAGKLTLNNSCVCPSCGTNFINVGEVVYVREDVLRKVAVIVEETDERITKIVQEKKVEDMEGNEGEVAGVISGRKTGSTILIDDFVVTGTLGHQGNFSPEPVLALDENREKSGLLKVIRKLFAERLLEVPILLLEPVEMEIIRKEAGIDKEQFDNELSRLINAGQEHKVGTFHSHESSGSSPSEQDIRIIKLKDDDFFGGKPFGKNDAIEAILSEFLIIFEKGSAREIGRIAILESACYYMENAG